MIDAAWGERPPGGARVQVQNRVSRLRIALASTDPHRIRTVAQGYAIDVSPGELDVDRFEAHRVAAAQLRAATSPVAAIAALRSALAEWHGPALHGLESPVLRAAADALEERRVCTIELLAGLQLQHGDAAAAIPDLTELTTRYPFRETGHELLMRAFQLAGRPIEALDVYRSLRATLADELGLEPNGALQRLQADILHCAPARQDVVTPGQVASRPVSAGSYPAALAQLPPGPSAFAGRSSVLTRLDMLADDVTSSSAARTAAITGAPGVGKSALALHWAHRVAARFPDGQLYADLSSGTPGDPPKTAARVLTTFLESLGVPPQCIPGALEARTALYRSLLASRRVLIVLDNAHDSDHVRPLLAGTGGSLTLVSSRNQLTGLVATEGARGIPLCPLAAGEAVDLLAQRIGLGRAEAEPDAVRAIVEACGRLPLALTITAVRAAMNPHLRLASVAAELGVPGRKLAAFNGGDTRTDLRSVFASSYGTLSSEGATMFRLIGRHPHSHIDGHTAANLARTSVNDALGTLDELTHASLVEPREPGHFTMHMLLKMYAANLPHRPKQVAARAS